ncbi:nucleoside deaminase [Leptospira ilyithenensis]|uniref:Nucleoside deaminase n=1 Tax=Leptospira ilyithenensis TaxID=2484901 RepID=A0A4R9LRU6_9LEPT|nr:nucleoside deaminase [Leptospira ilyithenensis]TGN10956.1 nucleoside deaminase [Leptospira ilyithenensis]
MGARNFFDAFLHRWSEIRKNFPAEIPSFTQIYSEPNQELISESFNHVESEKNATLHSEIIAIEAATKQLNEKYLTDAILITALEPCLQCAGAILRVKLPKIYYLLPAKPGEGISSYSTESIYLLNHFPTIRLIENSVIKNEFLEFFKEKR